MDDARAEIKLIPEPGETLRTNIENGGWQEFPDNGPNEHGKRGIYRVEKVREQRPDGTIVTQVTDFALHGDGTVNKIEYTNTWLPDSVLPQSGEHSQAPQVGTNGELERVADKAGFLAVRLRFDPLPQESSTPI